MTEATKIDALSFEQSMQELESIVARMEAGELPLEEALQSFERGVKLARHGQAKLKQAEQKVQMLMQNQEGESLTDFTPDNDAE
ncbi:exodeoxyribonuclease VII small subunit [Aestuariibacter salexigens]|uniref:exodeoxyribonuclease VII small subunit n=1 Tax=Aestuariibacter salexigens TaxID=226010 RepID=UPI000425AB85|nr:exodeoxyribonuclease VII small subunit [Aestuariibacter salexigens]